MKKWLSRLSSIEIVLIFLVILAGSVVRMTGSGMGCPDWPQCFGYTIPPTERSVLDWQPDRSFEEGQMIIHREALYTAKQDFTSGATIDIEKWEKYTKHDYAQFNPTHTWIEYINRLLGALSGLPMLALLLLSLWYLRQDYRYALLSLAGLFMLGFEAWLGKLVVDGNLIPGSITIHMLGAIMILTILLVFRGLLKEEGQAVYYTLRYRNLLLVALVLTLIQIILGTQVREEIDHLQQAGVARSSWMDQLDWVFYVHRSFSLVVLGVNAYLWYLNRRLGLGYRLWQLVALLLVAEILVGIILAYLDLPAVAQPVHLMLGAGLWASQIYLVIQLYLGKSKRVIPVR